MRCGRKGKISRQHRAQHNKQNSDESWITGRRQVTGVKCVVYSPQKNGVDSSKARRFKAILSSTISCDRAMCFGPASELAVCVCHFFFFLLVISYSHSRLLFSFSSQVARRLPGLRFVSWTSNSIFRPVLLSYFISWVNRDFDKKFYTNPHPRTLSEFFC